MSDRDYQAVREGIDSDSGDYYAQEAAQAALDRIEAREKELRSRLAWVARMLAEVPSGG